MNLREQFALDACAILNTDELGERALWIKTGQTSGTPRTVRLIEQPDRQTIRRAHVWTRQDGTATSQGDTFRVTRNKITTTWRVLYTDPAETALQRSYCHQQLTDTIKVTNRYRIRKQSGSTSGSPEEVSTSYKCKWFESSAEIVVDNKRRAMRGEWYCFLETVPENRTDMTFTDSDGRTFEVLHFERALNRVDLPYFVCQRADA